MHNLIPHFIHDQYQAGRFQGTLWAATLYFDIAGFTAMTQALMAQGKEGAEVMAGIINRLFEPVIDAVYEQGGFITNFAGDAFTAVFPAGQEDEAAGRLAVSRALAAAWAINRLFAEHGRPETPLGKFNLAAGMGLSAGMVEWGIIGPEEHRAYFFRGPAIEGCIRAEEQAGRGQVVLEKRLLGWLPAGATVEPETGDRKQGTGDSLNWLPAGYARLAAFPETARRPAIGNLTLFRPDPAIAGRFFPLQLWNRPHLGEFRQVAIVFLSFPDDLSLAGLEAFAGLVIEAADRFGGHFSEVDFGDMGGLALLYFGAPLAHENDLERALHFILALEAAVAARPDLPAFAWRAGVTFGEVYAGLIGAARRGKYTMLGNIVNFAARLMVRAGWGQTLVSRPVSQHPGFRFESLGNLAYKGFREPAPTYRLLGQQAAPHPYHLAMVGRVAELRQLVAAAQPLFSGRFAGVAIIYGEPGMGKSRLAYELRQRLSEQVTWLAGRCDQVLRQPFNPFIHFLRRYFRQSPDFSRTQNGAAFTAVLQQLLEALEGAGQARPATPAGGQRLLVAELHRTWPFLGALLDLHWPGSLYETLDAEGRYQNILAAVKTLLLAESGRRPVVLELEDGHWLDEASQELLLALTRQVEEYPLLIVITSRYDDDGRPAAFSLAEGISVTTIPLVTFQAAEVNELAESILAGPLDEPLQRFLEHKTQGNPFFVQQVLYYLRENNLLVRSEAGAWSGAADTLALPGSISTVLMARIDRLAPEVQEVVKAAAVLGEEFEVPILEQMLARPARPLVEAAGQEQVWSASEPQRYIFRHALLRDAAYDMQLRTRLREMHRRAAEAYEQVYAGDLERCYTDLAYHYAQAQEETQEGHYALLAGQQALARFNHAAAARYLSRALALAAKDDLAGRYELLRLREEAYEAQGLRAAQRADLEALAVLAGRLGDWRRPVEVGLRQAAYAQATGDYAGSAAIAQAATAQALAAEPAGPLAGQAQVAWASALQELGDYPAAQTLLEEALATLEKAGAAGEVARARLAMVDLLLAQALFQEARRVAQTALAASQSTGERRTIARALWLMGVVVHNLGEWPAAQAHYRQAQVIWQEIGYRSGQARVLNNLAIILENNGNRYAAEPYYQQALAIYREIGDRGGEAKLLHNLGLLASNLGKLAPARAMLQEVLAIHRQAGNRSSEALALHVLGELFLEEGEFELAEEYGRQALAIWRELGSEWDHLALYGLGQAAERRGDLATAEAIYRQCLAEQQRTGGRHLEESADLARVLAAQGQVAAAQETLAPVLAYLAENPTLEGVFYPWTVFLGAYHVLAAAGDPRAGKIIGTAYHMLQEQANKIGDPAVRRSFLENVHDHRVIVEEWRGRVQAKPEPGTE
ncbi:MAG: tetratricopeptide repeat protein [Chloroflexi bacterium]|nr:tetratricopeptide repeat protein [Chloroflexota bacterium]MCI0646711.1 tetratricopeptide repeat protein [Chloroflexota bacterium]MCI0726112.1 tetratricopeptide repeat protein [Chloroflexota bacterium]